MAKAPPWKYRMTPSRGEPGDLEADHRDAPEVPRSRDDVVRDRNGGDHLLEQWPLFERISAQVEWRGAKCTVDGFPLQLGHGGSLLEFVRPS
jgi:hypothetical protein